MADEVLSGGKAELVVKYMGIKLLDQTKDICGLSPDISCPIPAGTYTHTQTVPIPSVTPPVRPLMVVVALGVAAVAASGVSVGGRGELDEV